MKTKTLAKTFAIAMLSLCFVPAAMANGPAKGAKHAKQSKRERAQRLLEKFDRNGDHMLDAGELETMLEFRDQHKTKRQGMRQARVLERFDANHDGQLDDAERQAMHQVREAKRQEMLQRFDQNKNGTLEPAERQAMKQALADERFDKLLQRFDQNRDGAISWAEVDAQAGRGAKDQAGERGQKGQRGQKGEKGQRVRELFRKADADNNNVVTRAEFKKALQQFVHERGGKGREGGHRGPGAGHGFDD